MKALTRVDEAFNTSKQHECQDRNDWRFAVSAFPKWENIVKYVSIEMLKKYYFPATLEPANMELDNRTISSSSRPLSAVSFKT